VTRAAAPLGRFIQRTIITVEDLLMLGDNRDVDMLGSPKCYMSLVVIGEHNFIRWRPELPCNLERRRDNFTR
jgi:hypothetical protein